MFNRIKTRTCSIENKLIKSDTMHPWKFIVKRAFRFGSTTPKDVQEAFPLVSRTTCWKYSIDALELEPSLLSKKGKKIVPADGAKAPDYASSSNLLSYFNAGITSFSLTGLREEEFPAFNGDYLSPLYPSEDVLDLVFDAIINRRAIRILYAGLWRGEEARYRTIVPIGIEKRGQQIRLLAQDVKTMINRSGDSFRVFVLARLLDVKPLPRDRTFKESELQTIADMDVKVRCEINDEMTKDQKIALRNEFGIEDETVSVPKRSVMEFLIQNSDAKPNENAVWPPLQILE